MDALKQFSTAVQVFFAGLADKFPLPDPIIVAVLFALLCLISLASMRLLTVLGAVLLAAVASYLSVVSNVALPLLALCAAIGSLIISIDGIMSRRREADQRRDFEHMRNSIQNLEFALERKLLQSLNPQPRGSSDKEANSDLTSSAP